VTPCDTKDGKVISFGTAAGEDDLAGITLEFGGNRAAGAFEMAFGGLPEEVDTGGVAINVRHGLLHAAQDLRRNRSGSVVIEIAVERQISV
jgi:hypothetical protein